MHQILSEIQAAIAQLLNHDDLDTGATEAAMAEIMRGEATDAQIGAFLAALRMKGETVEEVAAAASVMRELSTRVDVDKDGNAIGFQYD